MTGVSVSCLERLSFLIVSVGFMVDIKRMMQQYGLAIRLCPSTVGAPVSCGTMWAREADLDWRDTADISDDDFMLIDAQMCRMMAAREGSDLLLVYEILFCVYVEDTDKQQVRTRLKLPVRTMDRYIEMGHGVILSALHCDRKAA